MHRVVLPFLLAALVAVTALPTDAQRVQPNAGVRGMSQAKSRKSPTPTPGARAIPVAAPVATSPPAAEEPSPPPPSPPATPLVPPPASPTHLPPTATVAETALRATTLPKPPAAALQRGGQLLVAPASMPPGSELDVAAKDFGPRERLSVWLTGPAGQVVAAADQTTGKDGQAYFSLIVPADAATGRWAATVQGQVSHRQAITSFTVADPVTTPIRPAATPGAPTPVTEVAPAESVGDQAAAPTPTMTATLEPTVPPTETPTPTATPTDNSDIAGLLPPDVPDATLSPRLARSYFGAAARMTGVPVEILLAVAAVESGFRPNAVGPFLPQFADTIDEHALGMMQFLPSTYRPYAPIVDRVTGKKLGMRGLWDPESAVFAAAFYLRDSGAPRDLRRALLRYNNADWYVRLVLAWADYYAKGGTIGGAPVIDRAQIYALPDPAARPPTIVIGTADPSADGQASHTTMLTTGLAELLGLVGDRLDWPRLQRASRAVPH